MSAHDRYLEPPSIPSFATICRGLKVCPDCNGDGLKPRWDVKTSDLLWNAAQELRSMSRITSALALEEAAYVTCSTCAGSCEIDCEEPTEYGYECDTCGKVNEFPERDD